MPNPSLPDFLSVAQDAQKRAIFVRLQLAGYKGHDESLKKIIIRPVLIKQKPNLSFTFQHKTRDIVKNFPLPDAWHAVSNALQNGFKVATLFTTDFDMAWPSGKKNKPTYTESPNLSHDHQKKRVIAAEGQAWLHALGITGADGKVLQSGQDKYKQINKFIELIAPIVADIKIPHVADMGSGKGYLTFALYDYLNKVLKKDAYITGIEDRADLVDLCNDIAFANDFDGLRFEQGRIANADITDIDVLIALHACDTATDDAIAKGIKSEARAIIVAPCCHKQIRREMEKNDPENGLDALTRHGVFLERQAEMVTDALRASYLEKHGYAVKTAEFISDMHTPKNVLIMAQKTKNPRKAEIIQNEITALKTLFGVQKHYLEQALSG